MKYRAIPAVLALLFTAIWISLPTRGDSLTEGMKGSKYYKVHPLFNPHPVEGKNYTVSRFGPVGIGIDLVQPAFQMKIRNVEKGSPADGKLTKGQTIESINGRVLKDIDPRLWLGQVIAKAEAGDGKLTMKVKDEGASASKTVVVQIPPLGAYSDTWPLDCPKSAKVVRGLADYLAKKGNHAEPGIDSMGLLFMLSTGEEKDLEVARGWVKELVAKYKDVKEINSTAYYTWKVGYGGPALCEYYLRTGDESVLHLINLLADYAKRTMYNGAWSHRGQKITFGYMGGAHLNAAGVHVVTFLLLAKECGAVVDEHTLQTSLKQFYRFAGRGNTAYGDQLPEKSFVDNGKTGALAFTMAAAASLTPEGEKSVYAKARDVSAVKGFYSTSWLNHGHTGGGIGEVWRGASMGLMAEKKPTKHREFMNERAWFYDISRRFDGSFGIVGGGSRYDKEQWGVGMGFAYTIPRKTLRLSGAPRTKFSKTHPLPKRPWGTAQDNEFYRLDPVVGSGLTSADLDAEKLATHASWAVYRVLADPKIKDKTLLKLANHQDHGVRRYAAGAIHKHKRDQLIIPLLKSKDPRARHAGTMVIYGTFKRRPMSRDRITDKMIKLLTKIIKDREESWWVVHNAMMCLSLCEASVIEPHFDRLLYWFEHEEWWLSTAAMKLLNKVATDPKYYKKLIPLYGKRLLSNRRTSPLNPVADFAASLKKAPPEVRKLGAEVLGKVYANFPTRFTAPGGVDMSSAADYFQRELTRIIKSIPNGTEVLKEVPKRSSAWQKSGSDDDRYRYAGKFEKVANLLGKWKVIDLVAKRGDFTSKKKMNPGKPPYQELVFQDGGKTNLPTSIWTGKNYIDLERNEVCRMEGESIDGEVYLFIEAGGFTSGKPKDWHPGWYVLKRVK